MKHIALIAAASALFTFGAANAAFADDCSGHDHDTGTVVGGVGGAAIGGLASHSIVGAVAGGVVGAVAGNAIDRSQDCDHQEHAQARAYDEGYADRAQEDAAPAPAETRAYDQGYSDARRDDYPN